METKVCTRCKDEKTTDLFYVTKNSKGEYSLLSSWCRKCTIKCNTERNRSLRNTEKVKEQRRSYRAKYGNTAAKKYKLKNKEKVNERNREYRKRTYNKEVEKRKRHLYLQKLVDKLSDVYVIKQLTKRGKLTKEDVIHNPELIEIKRVQILIHRLKRQIFSLKKANNE